MFVIVLIALFVAGISIGYKAGRWDIKPVAQEVIDHQAETQYIKTVADRSYLLGWWDAIASKDVLQRCGVMVKRRTDFDPQVVADQIWYGEVRSIWLIQGPALAGTITCKGLKRPFNVVKEPKHEKQP